MNVNLARLILNAYSTKHNPIGRSPLDIPRRTIWITLAIAVFISVVTGNLLMFGLYQIAKREINNSHIALPLIDDKTPANYLRNFLPEIKSRLPEEGATQPHYEQLFDSVGRISFQRYLIFAETCIPQTPKPSREAIQKAVVGQLVFPMFCMVQSDLFTQMEDWGFAKPVEDPEGAFSQQTVDYYTLFKATTKFRDQLGSGGDLTLGQAKAHRMLRLLGGTIQWATYTVFWWCLLLLLLRGYMAKLQTKLVAEGHLPHHANTNQIWQIDSLSGGGVPYFSALKKASPSVLLPAELIQDTLKEIALNPDRGRIENFLSERIGNWRTKVSESAYELINFLSNSIPSLGFVGTVLGIIAAMGAADMIIQVKDPVFQVESMNIITNSLAVAFDTTAVSLILALIIGYINAGVKKNESDFFERMETEACNRLKKIWNEQKTEDTSMMSGTTDIHQNNNKR